LGIHRQILPDAGGQFATQKLLHYSFILPYLCQNLTMSS
jgi:hypothetical protein